MLNSPQGFYFMHYTLQLGLSWQRGCLVRNKCLFTKLCTLLTYLMPKPAPITLGAQ